MNLINILVKLLTKAYHAEARKHHKLAEKHSARYSACLDDAERLRMQADAAEKAAEANFIFSDSMHKHALKVQAKAAEVSQFFTV